MQSKLTELSVKIPRLIPRWNKTIAQSGKFILFRSFLDMLDQLQK